MSTPLPPPSLRLLPLFDAHCHLQDKRLAQSAQLEGEEELQNEEKRHAQIDEIVARARSAGVAGVACCSTSERDWPAVAALADRYPGFVHPSFGLHPWFLEERKPGWEGRLEELLRSRPGAGVGESGLDRAATKTSKKRKLPPIETQLEVLREHARIARELRRPLTVHCVKAAGLLFDSLRPFAPFLKRGPSCSSSSSPPSSSSSSSSGSSLSPLQNTCVVFHGWQGPKEEVVRLSRLGEGVFFSLGARSLPPATEAGAKEKEEEEVGGGGGGLSHIPLSRLLIETDSPDGFEPRCIGEGLLAGAVEEVEVGEENDKRGSSLSGNIKQGLEAQKRNRNEKTEEKLPPRPRGTSHALNQPSNVAALLPHLAWALGEGEGDVARACFENGRAVFCGGG